MIGRNDPKGIYSWDESILYSIPGHDLPVSSKSAKLLRCEEVTNNQTYFYFIVTWKLAPTLIDFTQYFTIFYQILWSRIFRKWCRWVGFNLSVLKIIVWWTWAFAVSRLYNGLVLKHIVPRLWWQSLHTCVNFYHLTYIVPLQRGIVPNSLHSSRCFAFSGQSLISASTNFKNRVPVPALFQRSFYKL